MPAEQSNERVKPADVVVRLDRVRLEQFVAHALESADKFRLPAPVEPIVEELRAAFDSPPVEEVRQIEYRVVADFDSEGHLMVLARPEDLLTHTTALEAAASYRSGGAYKNPRAQVSETRRSPWTDLPSEEGERG